MLPDHQLTENQILVFGLLKMKKKKDKSKYLTKYVGITEQPVECLQQILANYGHTS